MCTADRGVSPAGYVAGGFRQSGTTSGRTGEHSVVEQGELKIAACHVNDDDHTGDFNTTYSS